MKVFTERDAEEFLKKHKFNIVDTIFIKKEKELDKLIEKNSEYLDVGGSFADWYW